jgi:hypothetical protein
MKREKMELLFELAEELYAEEQKKRGSLPLLPYAWAKNNKTGRFLAFSVHSKFSDTVEAKLKEIH